MSTVNRGAAEGGGTHLQEAPSKFKHNLNEKLATPFSDLIMWRMTDSVLSVETLVTERQITT